MFHCQLGLPGGFLCIVPTSHTPSPVTKHPLNINETMGVFWTGNISTFHCFHWGHLGMCRILKWEIVGITKKSQKKMKKKLDSSTLLGDAYRAAGVPFIATEGRGNDSLCASPRLASGGRVCTEQTSRSFRTTNMVISLDLT